MRVFHLRCEKDVDPKSVEEGLKSLGYEPTVYDGDLGGLDVMLPDKQLGDYEMFPLIANEIAGVIGVGPEPNLRSTTLYSMSILLKTSIR